MLQLIFGAFIERVVGFQGFFPIFIVKEVLLKKFASSIEMVALSLQDPSMVEHLKMQQKFVNHFENWKIKGNAWNRFLKGAINAKQ